MIIAFLLFKISPISLILTLIRPISIKCITFLTQRKPEFTTLTFTYTLTNTSTKQFLFQLENSYTFR